MNAEARFGPFASLHEAYAVLAEEVDELFQIVKQKQIPEGGGFGVFRNTAAITAEALDIAAVAIRIAADASRMARK